MQETNPQAPNKFSEAYRRAQHAMADLKSAVYEMVALSGRDGLRNADVGRSLGIYSGHERHQGHIPRTLLAIMEDEGVVEQDPNSKRWRLRQHSVDDLD